MWILYNVQPASLTNTLTKGINKTLHITNSYEFTTMHQFLEIGVCIYLLYMHLLLFTKSCLYKVSFKTLPRQTFKDRPHKPRWSKWASEIVCWFFSIGSRAGSLGVIWPAFEWIYRYGRMMMNDGYGRMIMNGLQILRMFLFANNLFLQVWKSFWAWTFSNVTSWDYPQSLVSSIPLEVSLFAELALSWSKICKPNLSLRFSVSTGETRRFCQTSGENTRWLTSVPR